MDLTSLDHLFWALSFIGHCILLSILIIRRRASLFPAFTTLIAANVLRTIVLFSVFRLGSTESYFYTYWSLAILDTALQIAVAYELAAKVFRPLGAWAPDVRRSFLAMAAVSIFIAVGMTWLAAPPTKTLRLAIVIRGDFFSSCLLSELFVSMIALSVTLGLPWRTHVARLAQGLGFISIFGIFTDAAHSYFGSDRVINTFRYLSRLQIALYLCAVTYWSVTLTIREPEPRKMPEELHAELRRLQGKAALMLKSLRTLGSAS